MSRLKDRIAVVSGAVTGMGKAVAIRLAAEGAIVEILDIQDASETVTEIRAAGGQAKAERCDVTSEAQIAQAVAAIAARHDHVGWRRLSALTA